jgi:hypothetical protein
MYGLYILLCYLVCVLLERLGDSHMSTNPDRSTHNVDGLNEERVAILIKESESER